jgi:serine/threonine protein kinase
MRLSPGDVLHGQYQITDLLARGGFGFVYCARDSVTGETVAIKELFPSLVGDSQMVQRFIQEARATLHLTHPNIARTHNIFQHGDTYYLVMEYLAGGSLADRLRREWLPVDEAVRIMRALCTALDYAHGLGVVHCDLKPANVLFDAQGEVHLADFGIAHVSDNLITRRMATGTGVAMGTVRYMAPEQLEGVRSDPRLDIYALGAILYEMLAGQPYLDFETETTPAAQMRNMQRIQREPPRPLRVVNSSVPEWLAQVVDRALRKAPEERFPTVISLQQALEPAPRLYVPPAEPRQRPQPRPAGWKWGLLAGVVALIILIVVSLALLLSGPKEEGSVGLATRASASIEPTAPLVVASSTLVPTTEPDTLTPFIEEASDTPTPSPTPTVPTATPTPTPGPSDAELEQALLRQVRWRPENGTPIFAYYADQPPALDGYLDIPGEWAGTRYEIGHVVYGPENWSGAADISGWCYLPGARGSGRCTRPGLQWRPAIQWR